MHDLLVILKCRKSLESLDFYRIKILYERCLFLNMRKNVRWLFITWVQCRQKRIYAQVRSRKAVKFDHEGLAKVL